MADAELTVRISGDTGDLESSISRVESQLSQLEKSGGRGAESIAKASLNQGGFAKTVEQSKKALDEKKAALAQTEKEYKKNSKAIQDNISGLEKQRSRLGNLAVSKQEEIDALRSSSKSLEKNSTAYRENQKAIQWTETELEAVKKQHRDVGRSIDEHRTALQNEEKTLEKARGAVANAEKQYKAYANNLEEVEKVENRLKLEKKAKGYKELGEGVDTLTKPIQAAGVAMAAGAVASAKFAVDFENNFADVHKTVDGTDAQLDKIKQDIIDMTTVGINGHSAIPQTTAELTELAAAGGQLGITVENISSFTETMAMIESATNLAGEEGAKTLARFMNVTGTAQNEIQNVGSAIVDLGNHTATTEAEIAEMAQRMGKYSKTVGISAADTLGYSAALSSLGVEAQLGGSAIGRTWLSIETAVAKGGGALEAFAKYAGVSANEFKKKWNTDPTGAFNGLLEGLNASENLTLALQALGINNTQDIQVMQALTNSVDKVKESVQRSNNAWSENTALVTEFEKKAGTTASQIQVMEQNLVEAGRSLGETFLPSINNGVVNIKELAQGIANMSDGQKQALITTGKWVIGLGAAGKATSGMLKGIGNTADALSKIKKAQEAGGVLAKFAPALTTIGGAASFAAVGIGLLSAGVWAGKKAYEAARYAARNYGEELKKSFEEYNSSIESSKELGANIAEWERLNKVISEGSAPAEELTAAKEKLKEVEKWLIDNYGVYLKSDTVTNGGGISEDEINGLKEQNALLKENAKLKMEMALHDAREKYDDAKSGGIDSIKEKREALAAENKAIEEQYQILNKYNAIWDKTVGSDAYKNASEKDKHEMYQKTIHDLNEEMKKFDKDYSGAGFAGVESDLDELHNKISKNTEAIDNYDKQLIEYNNSALTFKQTTRDMINSLIADMPTETPEAFFDMLDEIKSYGAQAELSAAEMQGFADKITEIGRAAGILQENQTIKIDAEGDISVMTEAEQAADDLNGKKVKLSISADGSEAHAVINGVEYKIAEYNKETGEATLTADGQKADMIVNLQTGKVRKFSDEEGVATLSAIDNASEKAKQAAEAINNIKDKTVTIKAVVKSFYQGVKDFFSGNATRSAKGTQDFKGGLAMINDEKGKADPRELVEVNGKGYIFEGRDVVVPLPKHTKVYTADQTRQIMSRKGVPRYAKGKNNEEWENAKADWTHYIKVNEVSAIDYLEHWDAMMRKFKGDAEVVKEIQEEIVASTKSKWDEDIETMKWYLDMGDNTEEQYFAWLEAYRDENFEGNKEYWRKTTLELQKWKREQSDALNEVSEAYIEYHTAMDDWDTVGDSQLDALQRVADRQKEDVTAGKRTEKEAAEYTKKLFQDSYNNRKQQSMDWLENQKKYNNMSSEDYISGLKRIEDYTEEYYKKGIIDFREYIESKNEIWRQEADEYINVVNGWHSDAELYERQASVFGWGFNGTGHKSEEEYWKAREQRELEFADDERLSENEREAARLRAAEARINYYSAADKRLAALSDEFKEAMDKAKDALDDRVQSLRDSWTVQDREKNISDTKKQLSLYENAVTKEGQDKYSQLQEELKQLEREQKIYEIEQDNNAIIKQLEAEYAEIEKTRKIALDSTVDACNSIEAYAKGTQDKIDALVGAVNTIVKMFEGSSNEGGMGTYSFNQTINAAVNGSAEVSALISRAGRFFGKPDFLK